MNSVELISLILFIMLVVGFIMCLVGVVLSKSADPDKQVSGRKVLILGSIFVGIPVIVAIFLACFHGGCSHMFII